MRCSVSCVILAAVLCAVVTGCSGLGKPPSDKQKEQYSLSPNFDIQNGIFKNRPDREKDVIRERRLKESRYTRSDSDGDPPDHHLPDIKTDFKEFVSNESDLKCVWFGHSSLLVKLDKSLILIDPVFDRSSPVTFTGGPRFQKSPVTRAQLPPIDFIVISHDHYDHLEMATARYFANKNTVFIVPLGILSHLRHWDNIRN